MTLRPLEEIERDAAAATPGPWQQYGEGVMRPGEKGYLCDAFAAPGSMEGLITFDLADARFIAKARTDVPALVARVRDLEGAYGTKMAAALVEMLRRSGVAEGELVMAVSSACARIAALEAQVATLTAERDAARTPVPDNRTGVDIRPCERCGRPGSVNARGEQFWHKCRHGEWCRGKHASDCGSCDPA